MMEGAWEAGRRLAHTDCERLLAGIARGDQEALGEFYQATDRAIYAYALSLTRSHHDAQDVMMETYLKIRSAAHLYQPCGKPMAWVFTIVKNLVRDQQRRAGREELATLSTVAGLAIVLLMVVSLVADLLTQVRTIFQLY